MNTILNAFLFRPSKNALTLAKEDQTGNTLVYFTLIMIN